jgi:transposase
MHIETGNMKAPINYKSYTLDHLGLVAGLYDELNIGEHIDKLVPQDHKQRHVTLGTAIKAMIINGLGFSNHALYLMPHFYQDKPVEHLLGSGVMAEHLNDDMLGRALDNLYAYGVTPLYSQIAAPVIRQLGLTGKTGHLDSTTFHMDGRLNSDSPPEDTDVIHITKGYSRDHRPDLNQVSLQLIVESQAGIPTLMRTLSGNEVDTKSFNDTLNNHIGQLENNINPSYLIGDAALYTKDNLKSMSDCYWISRVPESLKSAKEVIDLFAEELAQGNQEKSTICIESHYAGVQQRWLLIYSKASEERAQQSVSKQMLKQSSANEKAFRGLCREEFSCEKDAKKALDSFCKKLTITEVFNPHVIGIPYFIQSGRPKKDQKPDGIRYSIRGQLASLIHQYEAKIKRKSCFILATNQMDNGQLSEKNLIDTYKNQQKVERGFRFMKDPLFHASTLYLKSPQRIMALMMVMTLCLLVYSALEYRIRSALQKANETFPDQKGAETIKPTARWIFQFFTGIHLLVIQNVTFTILNLNQYHRQLLNLLGKEYQNFYSDG